MISQQLCMFSDRRVLWSWYTLSSSIHQMLRHSFTILTLFDFAHDVHRFNVSLIRSRTCAALLHYLQQCSLLSTLVCVCVCAWMCVLLPVCACVQMHAYTSRERQVWGKQEKCIKGTAHRTYGMHSALSASGSWTQQNTRSNLIWLTVKQRNLRGPFETISRQSLQTIFLH